MFLWIKCKYKIKLIRKKLINAIRFHNPNYTPENTIDPKVKIVSFLTYFVSSQLKLDILLAIKQLEQHQIIGTYIEMMKNNNELCSTKSIIEKIKSLSSKSKQQILTTSIYAEPLVKLMEPIFHVNNINLPSKEMSQLFNLIIKLILINYHTPQFKSLAKDNLNNDYQQNVEFIIIQTTLLSEIHKTLKIITPRNVNDLIIFLNYLLKPLKK